MPPLWIPKSYHHQRERSLYLMYVSDLPSLGFAASLCDKLLHEEGDADLPKPS